MDPSMTVRYGKAIYMGQSEMNDEKASIVGQERLPSKGPLSLHQHALLLFWVSVVLVALFRWLLVFVDYKVSFFHSLRTTTSVNIDARYGTIENGEISHQKSILDNKDSHNEVHEQKPQISPSHRPSFDSFLSSIATFGSIMFFFYLCDDKHYFPVAERIYSRDLFWFLVLLLFSVAAGFTRKLTTDKILNREQTEEWKGWMQVMFVWYHYFKAAETYNAIRIFIAAYVWMTGFGNFSFFWVKKDFSLYRVLKMLFRLNFLVVVTCLVVRNEYMLYYICPMHTFWFLSVYCFMRLLNNWNDDPKKMAVKFAVYFFIIFLLFDVPGVGEIVFKPFRFILKYQNSLHEWMFRAGLDHYATLLGMLCAYFHPNFEKLMRYLDEKQSANSTVIRFGIALVCLCAFTVWARYIFVLEKYEYNKLHPYFSFIPLLSFIFLRNMFPFFRKYYLHMFTWLGKITLETYISQLHIYLQDNAKMLISFIPGYPLLNFALASVIYLLLSHYLFHLTIDISAYVIPKDLNDMIKTLAVGSAWLAACYAVGFILAGL
ncbi:uncharacterized protein [Montipora capricornis]|uniref:uncharacterized protein isoform X2 n=1 Tax=Montipora capricornis TaxID=246305 RepID=UPI0035F197F1